MPHPPVPRSASSTAWGQRKRKRPRPAQPWPNGNRPVAGSRKLIENRGSPLGCRTKSSQEDCSAHWNASASSHRLLVPCRQCNSTAFSSVLKAAAHEGHRMQAHPAWGSLGRLRFSCQLRRGTGEVYPPNMGSFELSAQTWTRNSTVSSVTPDPSH